ncbi:MAG: LytR C-terminal domain-containing protein [Deltaproteobacteria bacterium]|nr:LytR C-terminal domain-containing protein [Deltaproteobacteria bacterium]MCL5277808.1 LytR C-terminal domain-containing protein [Deltaproteobacteria bacterium]
MRGAERLIAVALIVVSGCASSMSSKFLLPSESVDNIGCIAVLPLKNETRDPQAGKVVSDILSIGLMQRGGFNIMDRMEVERVLGERDIHTPGGISPEDAAGMGIILGVQAVFAGRVTRYVYTPSDLPTEGAVPAADFSLSLIDTATGQTIWTGSGKFVPSGLLATGTTPLADVVQDGVSSLLDSFYSGIGQRAATSGGMCWYDPNTIMSGVVVASRPAYPPAPRYEALPVQRPVQQQVASVRPPEQRPQVAQATTPARVSILNASGSPRTSALVGITLIKNKINVVNVSVEKIATPSSVIYYKPAYYEQALAIARLLKKMPKLVQMEVAKWDITLIVGKDFR